MAKLIDHFDHFLESTVNLNQSRIDQLDSRLASVEAFLNEHASFSTQMVGDELIPQGSYAHRTIIKPTPGHEFDADALVPMFEQPAWEPCDYIETLYRAFRSSGTYMLMAHRRTRCVVIDYANDFHIDLVPYIERAEAKYITNRKENRFELTNPERFNEWLDDKTRTTSGNLTYVIRLMKYLRDFKQTFTVPSVILTTLLGDRVNFVHTLQDPDYYADVPTSLRNIVADLDEYLQANEELPFITDPGGTGEDYAHRWTPEQYSNFRTRISRYSELISEAFAVPDADASEALWQNILGSTFRAPPVEKRATLLEQAAPATERFLDRDFGISSAATSPYRVKIVGRVVRQSGFRTYDLPTQGNQVLKGRKITFRIAECDVPAPYEIYWKVRNHGKEAADHGQLRGEITHGGSTKQESTAYRGRHWVECYIVKDGVCVARDRQPVLVR